MVLRDGVAGTPAGTPEPAQVAQVDGGTMTGPEQHANIEAFKQWALAEDRPDAEWVITREDARELVALAARADTLERQRDYWERRYEEEKVTRAMLAEVRAELDGERERADTLERENEGLRARYDSYEPGTMEGQVRAVWELAEHYGHPAFSSRHPVGFLSKYVVELQRERDKALKWGAAEAKAKQQARAEADRLREELRRAEALAAEWMQDARGGTMEEALAEIRARLAAGEGTPA